MLQATARLAHAPVAAAACRSRLAWSRSTASSASQPTVALITGGASGIGAAFAEKVLESGVDTVVLADYSSSRLALEACSTLGQKFGADRIVHVRCDVSSPEQLHNVFSLAEHRGTLKIVCNNAGTADERHWRKQIDVNLTAVIEGTYLGIQHMRAHGQGGVIINTSSLGGILPQRFCPVYSATKAGVIAFTRSLDGIAQTDRIRVNVVCPSYTDTPFLKTVGLQDDAAASDMHTEAMTKLRKVIAATGTPILVSQVAEAMMTMVNEDLAGAAIMCTQKGNRVIKFPLGDPIGEPLTELLPTPV